jgi:hypothetical protein
MMGPTVFRVVDSTGQEHGRNMTSEQATAMMQVLLAARPTVSMRSERMDTQAASQTPLGVPPTVASAAAEAALGIRFINASIPQFYGMLASTFFSRPH